MSRIFSRKRSLVFLFVLCTAVSAIIHFGPSSLAETAALFAPTITATKTDAIFADVDGDGRVDPGDTIEYTVTINNNGASPVDDATGVKFEDILPSTLTLVPGSVTVSPIAFDDAYTATGNVSINQPAAGGLLANDINPISGGNTGLSISGLGGDNSAPFDSGTTANGGIVTSGSDTDGRFTYTPPPGYTGDDSFTYTVVGPGGLTTTGTAVITISDMIWFINASAPGGGNGTLTNPFNCYTGAGCFSAVAVDDPGDNIFLFNGSYTGGDTLLNNQRLIGQGASESILAITGITLAPNSSALPATALSPASVTISTSVATVNVINLGQENTLRGFTVGNVGAGAAGIVGNTIGTLTVGPGNASAFGADVVINTNGTALALNGGTFANTKGFASVTSSGGTNNVSLTGLGGTVRLGTGALSGASAGSIILNGGTALLHYDGSVTKASGTGGALEVSGGHATGVVSLGGTWNASAGTGLQFNNADSSYLFGGIVTLNGGDAGIDITNGSSGQVSITNIGSVITNPNAGSAFNMTGSSTSVSYAGTITQNTASQRAVVITGQTGTSTTAFSGPVNSTALGILLGGTAGNVNTSTTTIVFQGGMNLNTGANAAFTATSAGTLTVCDEAPCNPALTGGLVNTITTTTGTALNVASTTIGGNNLEFRSINVDGTDAAPTNGIILNNTGNLGGLVVKGTGSAGSGGTIRDTSGDGVTLTSTSRVSLDRMIITSNLGSGIRGSVVNGFVLANSSITTNGDSAANDESGIFIENLTGSAAGGSNPTSITNNTISNNWEFEINIVNNAGSATTLTNLQMSGNTISADGTQPNHGNLMNLLAVGTGPHNMTLNLTSGAFTGNTDTSGGKIVTATGLQCDHSGTSGTITCNVSGATFTNNNVGPQASVAVGGQVVLDFNGNTITGTRSHGINLFADANPPFTKSINGRIRNNTVGTVGVANSGSQLGPGIRVQNEGSVPMTLAIENNTVQQTQSFQGINVNVGISIAAPLGGAATNLTIFNNSFNNIGSRAIVVQDNDASTSTKPTICVNMTSNFFGAGIAGQAGDGSWVRLRELSGTFNVTQATPTAAVNAAELDDQQDNGNDGTGTKYAISGTPQFSQPACSQPAMAASIDDEIAHLVNRFNNLVFLNNHVDLTMLGIVQKVRTDLNATNSTSGEDAFVPFGNSGVVAAAEGSFTVTNQARPIAERSAVVSFVTEIADKLYSAIMPTVYSQEVERPAVRQRAGEKPSGDDTQSAKMAGETFCVEGDGEFDCDGGGGFTLPAGKSVTITFRATAGTVTAGSAAYTTVSNQGTVTFNEAGSPVVTNDPDTVAGNDATVTNIDHTTVVVTALPASPTVENQSVTFTATLTGVPTRGSDPSGTVEFWDGPVGTGTQIGAAAAVVTDGTDNNDISIATVSTTTLALGAHTINAYFIPAGGSGYNSNTGSAAHQVNASADVTITKTDSPDTTVLAGQNITYTVTVNNTGPSDAQSVALSDPIPANTTFVSATPPSGWTRTDATAPGGTGTLTFTKDAALTVAEGAQVFTVVVNVNQTTADLATITNTATATSATADPTTPNTAQATTSVSNVADLAVTKLDTPDPVVLGNNITYTIDVANNGTNAALNALVSDAVPTNTTLVSASVISGAGWTRTDAIPSGGTGTITFANPLFANAGTAQFQIVLQVNAAVTINNSASISSSTFDTNVLNNSANTSTDVIVCAPPPAGMVGWWTGDGHPNDIAGGNDGTLEGDATYAGGKVGQAFTFDGTGDFVEVPDDDSLDVTTAITIDAWVNPAGAGASGSIVEKGGSGGYALNLVSGSPQLVVGGSSATSTAVLAANTWTHVAATYNGANIVIYVNGNPETTAAAGAIPANTSLLTIGTGFSGLIDEVEVFDVALDEATIDGLVAADAGGKCKPVDLEITKTDGDATAVPGGTVSYTLNYANYGEPASGVVLTETVPANTVFNAGSSTPGWVCAPNNNAGSTCTLNVGSLATGATGSATFAITVVNPLPAGISQISNTAAIAGGTEMDTGDNSATDTTPIDAAPDMSITKGDGGASVAPGGTVAYTLTYTNSGNQGATGVILTETVPVNTTFNSGASTAGWVCAPNNNAGSTCTLAIGGTVAGGGGNGNATFAVTVLNPVAAGVSQISNTASVADDGTNGADSTPGNNTASDTTPVTAQPDFTISKTDGGASVEPGGTVAYTLNYANGGNQGATGVVITETVPANTTFNSGASTGGWVCVPDGNAGSTCTFAIGALGAGSNGSVTFAVTLPTTGLSGVTQISNTATIADDGANGIDPTLPNTSTDTTPRVCQTITVNNPTNDTGLLGTPFSETFTQTGGFGTLTYTLASGTLPNGITLSTAGVLSGTPTQSGLFPITVKVTDGNGCEGVSVTYNLNITCNIDPVVLNNADSGFDSLRYAVATACPGSTITFNMNTVVSPIGLSSGHIVIDKNLTIQGPGADVLSVNNVAAPSGTSRIFTVLPGQTVGILGLTVSGGNVTGPDPGPGIVGGDGGGIINRGTLTLTGVTVSGNSAARFAGGIRNFGNGTLTVVDSTISNNTAVLDSGAISNTNSLTIRNSTISGNSTLVGSGSPGGGAIFSGINAFASLSIANSTITNNSTASPLSAGGVMVNNGSAIVSSNIIAGNVSNATVPDVGGNFVSTGYNLIGNVGTATGFVGPGDMFGVPGSPLDPQIGALFNNGGPTQTHALLPTSPAVDKGNSFGLTTDQRGFIRPFDMPAVNAADGSDIGAYELNTVPTTTTVTASSNPSVWGETVTFTAKVETDPGGGAVTVGNVDFSLDGNSVATCQNVALNGSGEAQCVISGLSLGGHTIFAEYDENLPFLASSGSMNQTVNKADTTVVITGDTPDPTLVGDPYTVTWTVNVVAPGAGTPTGTVTVTDGTGGQCTAPVATGFCTLTSTTVGVKNLVATYSGDAFFNASTSAAVQHTAAIRISGNIRQFPGMTPLGGITVTLSGINGNVAVTNSNGDYTFIGVFTGAYTITPSGPIPGKSYDPISRSISNITTHTSGINFTAYNTSQEAPRKLRVVSQFAVPGDAVSVPVTIESQGNEWSVSFSIQYDPALYSAPPTVVCGADAGPGCTITTNYTQAGKVGIKVVPQTAPLAAGTRELVKLNFQTVPTLASNTPVDLIVTPTHIAATDANGDPLLVELHSGGLIVMQQGFEGDVANSVTGDGQLLSNDVIVARQFAVGIKTPNEAYNELQRVDTAPFATKGDGMLTSADVIQARRYASGISPVTGAGGPFTTVMGATAQSTLSSADAPRQVRVVPTNGVAGYRMTVPIEMKGAGDELAVGFILEYDAMKFSNPKVELAGVAPADAVLTVNDTESGRLTILVDAETPFSASIGQLANVTFDVAANAPSGDTTLTLSGITASDAEATELPSAQLSGTVTINGANANGISISGRVLTPSGGGLRNALVTITDAEGARRTVMTSSAGYYQFHSVAAGRGYQIAVISRRYRFTPRIVEPSSDLADVDFTGQE